MSVGLYNGKNRSSTFRLLGPTYDRRGICSKKQRYSTQTWVMGQFKSRSLHIGSHSLLKLCLPQWRTTIDLLKMLQTVLVDPHRTLLYDFFMNMPTT